jgi:hypothetical protein
MRSAAIAKQRLQRLTWDAWARRVDVMLSVAGLSRADFPQYPFRSTHLAGVSASEVAIRLLAEHAEQLKGQKVSV